MRTLRQNLLVNAKLALDRIRPYRLISGMSPFPRATMASMGAVLHESACLGGRNRLYEPCWFQMNSGASARDIDVDGPWFCYVGENVDVDGLKLSGHTLALSDGVLTGRSGLPEWTLGVDLEGCAAFHPVDSPQGREMTARAAGVARELLAMVREFDLPSTWYTVGSMFEDPAMGPVCKKLIRDANVEIGWHSADHKNFTTITRAEAETDMEQVQRMREKFGLELNAMAMPYNALGHVETLMAGGFSLLRCYVGQYYLPDTALFDNLAIRCSSAFIGPLAYREALDRMDRNDAVLHAFLHPVDWIGERDLSKLRICLERFAKGSKRNDR